MDFATELARAILRDVEEAEVKSPGPVESVGSWQSFVEEHEIDAVHDTDVPCQRVLETARAMMTPDDDREEVPLLEVMLTLAHADVSGALREAVEGLEGLRRTRRTDLVRSLVAKHPEAASAGLVEAACERGHSGVVRVLMRHGAPTVADPSRLLDDACRRGDAKVARALLESGAAHADHWALWDACRAGRVEIVRTLLDHGCRAEADDDEAIVQASGAGRAEVVRLLVERGADPCARDGEPARLADGDEEVLWALRAGRRPLKRRRNGLGC